jgi:hypothetical protein
MITSIVIVKLFSVNSTLTATQWFAFNKIYKQKQSEKS